MQMVQMQIIKLFKKYLYLKKIKQNFIDSTEDIILTTFVELEALRRAPRPTIEELGLSRKCRRK